MASIHAMKDTIENKAYVSEYVHTLTHELKSPLTAIRASSEILTDELSLAEREQFTGIILSQTDKLTALVDKLLTLAKIEQPTFKLTMSDVDLDALIQTCLNQQSATLKQLDKTVQFTKSGIHIRADEFWLTQAVQNVIDNAIYYGKSTIVIHISQNETDTFIHIKTTATRWTTLSSSEPLSGILAWAAATAKKHRAWANPCQASDRATWRGSEFWAG